LPDPGLLLGEVSSCTRTAGDVGVDPEDTLWPLFDRPRETDTGGGGCDLPPCALWPLPPRDDGCKSKTHAN
jgi:hypothetical protein